MNSISYSDTIQVKANETINDDWYKSFIFDE